jgi:type 1 glutamine amidotransferase/Ca2+-binding EF-hand superfamily protein
MKSTRLTTQTLIAAGAVSLLAITMSVLNAQAPGGSGRGGRGAGGGVAGAVFTAVDANGDGTLTRDELKSSFDAWYASADTAKAGSITQSQLTAHLIPVVNKAKPADVQAMMAALPTTPGAKPARARKVLVFANAAGFVHSSIPLAAKTVEALGDQGKLWTTAVSYDPADINTANLKQYDLIFLDSTTGCFLDDPKDKAATDARRAAFLDFVRSGKGIAGIHAATDSYHSDCTATGGGGGSSTPLQLAALLVTQGDQNGDKKLTRAELDALADSWFDKLDTDKTGKIYQADFTTRFTASVMPAPAGGAGFPGGFNARGGSGGGRGGGRGGSGGGRGGEPTPTLQWPEFNKLIGGYFKFHWVDPQEITVKIDDPKSPVTAMFHGEEFVIHDETYTFAQDSFSRKNVHVLTSIDYDKMTAADKAKEQNPRTDGDYALSYIHREGKGRVFYEGHGHDEKVYAITPMLEHVRAGIQYALGDLKADDSPSVK